MFFSIDQILVLGHRNPDTDAAASAQGYAEFLNQVGRYDSPVLAAVPGELTPQSRFVFERAGIAPPPRIESLSPQVCHVATRTVQTISVEDRFRDAIELLIRSDHSMLPVLRPDGKLHSVFSHRRDVSRYLLGFDVVPLMSRILTWEDLVKLPGGRAAGTQPGRPELSGNLRLALEGDGRWRETIEPDDVLVCGDLALTLELPRGRFPRWIVLASAKREPDPAAVLEANNRGAALMLYPYSAADFVLSLMSQVRIGSLDLGTGACVGEFDYLEDVQDVISASRHALPVLAADGTLAGVISRGDLQAPPRRRIILIDHFESSQAIAGREYAEILEIIDHHRVGDIETAGPVRVDCRPLGSSSTVVALNFFENSLLPDKPTASILLGGLVADTLCLRSPTTTDTDRKVASRLAELAGIEVEEFGLEVLRAGDDILVAEPAAIWNRDQKVFSIQNRKFAVAQLETVSLEGIPAERLEALRAQLVADFSGERYLISLLYLTDILTGDSWVTACESLLAGGIVKSCYGDARPYKDWTLAKGIVSRKKQIVPTILRALAECRL